MSKRWFLETSTKLMIELTLNCESYSRFKRLANRLAQRLDEPGPRQHMTQRCESFHR